MEGHSLTSVGISATEEEMVEVMKKTKKILGCWSVVMATLQVVNAGVQVALDEFVRSWVGQEVDRLSEGMEHMEMHSNMHRMLEEAGQNLRRLINNLVDLVQHFAADSPVTVTSV